jgi:hypothetical protein
MDDHDERMRLSRPDVDEDWTLPPIYFGTEIR